MWGIVPIENKEVKQPLKSVSALSYTSELLRGMASCHSLAIINGELGGDPLDIKVRRVSNFFFCFSTYLWII